MALIEKLVAIGNAIRLKTNTTEALTLDQMSAAIEGIQGGEECDHSDEDGLISGLGSEYRNDRITEVGNYAFYNNTNIVTLSLSNVTKIGQYAFRLSSALKNTYFPKLDTVGPQGFRSCTSMEEINLPSLVSGLPSYSFEGCTSLWRADLGIANSISSYCFKGCSVLVAIILRKPNAVTQLTNINALDATPVANGDGYVYVPRRLVDEYKVASNWTTFADQVRAIEDYPEITGG